MLDWPHEFWIIGVSLFYLLLGFALGLVSLWGSSHLILVLLETSPWGLFLCIDDLLLVLCIGIWRSSLGLCIGICDLSLSWGLISWLLVFISCVSIMHWDLEIFPWLMHWDLWIVLILRFVIWSHGFLCSSLVWWPLWDCWRSLRVSSGRNLIRVSWRET